MKNLLNLQGDFRNITLIIVRYVHSNIRTMLFTSVTEISFEGNLFKTEVALEQ